MHTMQQGLAVSSRPRKRQVQGYFNQQLEEWVIQYPALRGTVAVLPGPWNAVKVIEDFAKNTAVENIVGFEQDSTLYETICRNLIAGGQKEFARKSFFCADIAIAALLHRDFYIYWDRVLNAQDPSPWRASGIDYDMCTTLTVREAARILEMCAALQYNDNPFWFRLTCCCRCLSAEENQKRLSLLQREIATLPKITLIAWETHNYRDTMAMSTTQFLCVPISNSGAGGRTIHELSKQELDMVKTLMIDVAIRKGASAYTEEDIRIYYDLTSRTMAQLLRSARKEEEE